MRQCRNCLHVLFSNAAQSCFIYILLIFEPSSVRLTMSPFKSKIIPTIGLFCVNRTKVFARANIDQGNRSIYAYFPTFAITELP